jgi:hypothetical protein
MRRSLAYNPNRVCTLFEWPGCRRNLACGLHREIGKSPLFIPIGGVIGGTRSAGLGLSDRLLSGRAVGGHVGLR